MGTTTNPTAHRSGLPPALRDESYAWFVLLEGARRRGDYEAAAKADAELRRLGVRVAYGPPSPKSEEGGAR